MECCITVREIREPSKTRISGWSRNYEARNPGASLEDTLAYLNSRPWDTFSKSTIYDRQLQGQPKYSFLGGPPPRPHKPATLRPVRSITAPRSREMSDATETWTMTERTRTRRPGLQVLGKAHLETSHLKSTRDVAQQTSNDEITTNPQSPDQSAVASREGTNKIWTQDVQEARSRHLSLYDLEISAGLKELETLSSGNFHLSIPETQALKQASGEFRTFIFRGRLKW